jgi:Skp family chaperone for outer membrane proteins
MPYGFPVVLATAAALLIGAGIPAAAHAQDGPRVDPARVAAPAGQPKLGVVDLGTCFKQYKKSEELERKINDERERLKKDLDAQRSNISKLIKQLDDLLQSVDETSETYQIKEDEKDAAVARFDRTKKRLEEILEKRWKEYNLQLLEDIEKVVRAYGAERAFTLILKVDGGANDQQKMALAGLRAVMYYDKALDITADVVTILNREWELKGGSLVAPPKLAPEIKPTSGAPGIKK